MQWKARATSNKNKQETKTNKRQCQLSSVQVQDPWRQSGRNQNDYGGKDLWKRWVLSPEWKVEGVIDGESKLVTVMRWHAQDEVNQEESEQNEVGGMKKGADSTGKVMHI